MIKIHKKEKNDQKEMSTKCVLGTTKKCGPFIKIDYHKLYIQQKI